MEINDGWQSKEVYPDSTAYLAQLTANMQRMRNLSLDYA